MVSRCRKITSYVPVDLRGQVNATVHVRLLFRAEWGKSIFSEADFEFRQWIHTEGRVKRLNVSIDLQMLLTALGARAVTHLTWRSDAVCSYCHRFPLYMSVGKLESAGSGVNLCVKIGRRIHELFFHAKEDRGCSRERNDLLVVHSRSNMRTTAIEKEQLKKKHGFS